MRVPALPGLTTGRARFCGECGTRVRRWPVPLVGAKIEHGQQVLWRVRRQSARRARGIQQPASTAEAATRFTSPETYTPQHLAERIITSRAALEGERKQVTVLFADLKGSMELLADRDPEEARAHPRSGARTHDGGGASLRGHGQPGDGRRHHGAVRGAARPRGPRRARLLRRAAACRTASTQYAEEVRRAPRGRASRSASA